MPLGETADELASVVTERRKPFGLAKQAHRYIDSSRASSRRKSLTVSVAGTGARRSHLSDGRTLWRRVHTDSSYCSASDPRLHFGLGTARAVSLEVIWRDGNREKFTDLTRPIRKSGGRNP